MDGVVLVLVLLADVLELGRDRLVVETLARVFRNQIGPDHRAGEITRHQLADDAGLDDVAADGGEILGRRRPTLQVGRELRRDDIAPGEAVLDHFDEADVRGEDRAHARIVGFVDGDDVRRDLLHELEEFLVEHVAVLGHDGHQDAVRTAEVLLVLQEGLHVLVIERDLLLEPRIDPELAGEIQHHHRDDSKQHEHQRAGAEDQALGRAVQKGIVVGTGSVGHGIHFSWVRPRPFSPATTTSRAPMGRAADSTGVSWRSLM